MKIAKEGFLIILCFFCAGTLSFFFHLTPLAGLFGALFLASLYFFRDPERNILEDDRLVLSPADGRVVEAARGEDEMLAGKSLQKISIFLSLFDVHITRAPVGGKILKVVYRPGRFFPAQKPGASEKNEQNAVLVSHQGQTVIFRLVAGLIARRIVFNKKESDFLRQGERIGMIRFGSRVDLFFDPEMELLVRVGDKVKGGLSPIARKKGQ
jgi:phosphatidylserine decarboxylase